MELGNQVARKLKDLEGNSYFLFYKSHNLEGKFDSLEGKLDFHSSVWSRCTTDKNHSIRQLNFAVITAWLAFNCGKQSLNSLDKMCGINVGENTTSHRQSKETKWLDKSLWAEKECEKERRKKIADGKSRTAKEDAECSYGTGMFKYLDIHFVP